MFTHTLDICFNVRSDKEDYEDLTEAEIHDALRQRIENLRFNSDGELLEAVGLVETYEED